MAASNAYNKKVLQTAVDLITKYNRDPRFQITFNEAAKFEGAIYKKVPLKTLFYTLTTVLGEKDPYYQTFRNQYRNPNSIRDLFMSRLRPDANQNPDYKYLLDALSSNNLRAFGPEEEEILAEADETGNDKKIVNAHKKILDNKPGWSTPETKVEVIEPVEVNTPVESAVEKFAVNEEAPAWEGRARGNTEGIILKPLVIPLPEKLTPESAADRLAKVTPQEQKTSSGLILPSGYNQRVVSEAVTTSEDSQIKSDEIREAAAETSLPRGRSSFSLPLPSVSEPVRSSFADASSGLQRAGRRGIAGAPGAIGRGIKSGLGKLGGIGGKVAAANPVVGGALIANKVRKNWKIILIIIFAIFFFFFDDDRFNEQLSYLPPTEEGSSSATSPNISNLTVKKVGTKPDGCTTNCEVANGEDIGYRISVIYKGGGEANLEITDKIAENTQFKSAPEGVFENGVVKWKIEKLKPNQEKILSLVVSPTKENFWAVNNAGGSITSVTGLGGDIFACTFTRAGVSAPYKSSILSSMVSQAAGKTGVPSGVLASVARHENPEFTTNADDNHDGVKNDYYYYVNPEGARAVGLTQLSTGVTGSIDHCENTYNAAKNAAAALGKQIRDKSYYCVDELEERVKRFCNTNRTDLSKNYYAPDKADDGYINLCKISDNLTASAELLKGKAGSSNINWADETTVKNLVKGYYGACSYGSGDYCAEVWNDYQKCQTTTAPTVPKGKIVVLDPGHTNPDKFGEGKADENRLNQLLVGKIQALLTKNGFSVIITRANGAGGSSYYSDLQDRINIANQAKAAAFVSIHFDNVTASRKGSVTAYYRRPNDSASRDLGSKISNKIAEQLTGYKATTPEAGDYYLLNQAGAETDCLPNGQVNGYAGVTCNPASESKVQKGLDVPGIIQEIFPGNVAYSSLEGQADAISLGYCNGISAFLGGNGDCTKPSP